MLAMLNDRKASQHIVVEDATATATNPSGGNESSNNGQDFTLSRNEVFKRIEEDRERHKRLRERRWVQPISHNPDPKLIPRLASFMPIPEDDIRNEETELSIDIEFDNEWETTSDWNEDDDDAAVTENELCYPYLNGR